MALLEDMPVIDLSPEELAPWAAKWHVRQAFGKKEGMDFGQLFDARVAHALATMLGGINVVTPSQRNLGPEGADVVELGPVRVIGGIRPQNYDVGYRPDGVRFVFDSKTLNDTRSVGKNFQNMVNDLATEATTVHMRFPYALVAFMVVIPSPAFTAGIRVRFTRMLDRLVSRNSPVDAAHKAEAVSLVLWNPEQSVLEAEWPPTGSPLRVERFSEQVQRHYYERYDGMPPHDRPSPRQRPATDPGAAQGEAGNRDG